MEDEVNSQQSSHSNGNMQESLQNMDHDDPTVSHGKNTSTKPLSSVWKHFTVKKDTESKRKWAVCHYCRKDMYPHCDRMRRHLMICPHLGSICAQQGVNRLSRIQDVLKKDKTPLTGTKAVKRKNIININSSDIVTNMVAEVVGDDDDESEGGDLDDEQMRMITKLIQEGLPKDALKSSAKLSPVEVTTHSTRSLRSLTDHELEREEKELRVQKLRLDVGLKRKQNLLYSRLNKNFGKIIKATEVYLENSSQLQSVHVARVYTSGSGDQEGNILHEAYQATLQDGQHQIITNDPQDLTFDPSKAAVSYSSAK